MTTSPQDMARELRQLLGEAGVVDAADLATRSAGAFRADNLQAAVLARPASTDEVAAVVRCCASHGVSVVPQGGLTGVVHGADAGPQQVILSLERMRHIEQIDPVQRTATVQAGVTVQALQEAAEAQDLMFPLDLGARGSATLGGVASTNAGGNRVIRYGMTREMVLGLEVVLADGTVVDAMNRQIKNNTGYDLKHWFIGAEGTLGVITRLVLRLREQPMATSVALVACNGFDAVAQLLKHMDRALGGSLSAFEVMWPEFYALVTGPQAQPPVPQGHAFYVLIESQGASRELDAPRFEAALASALESGWVADAAIAQSEADGRAFWALRDSVERVFEAGHPIAFDISLPIGEMAAYVDRLRGELPQVICEEHQLVVFGHLGDGNLHVLVVVPPADAARLRPQVEQRVYGGLRAFRGAISAEHGIGEEKKAYLGISRTVQELALMRTLKAALDPRGLLNPGKVL
jgi:FAD/FMN-containing dehydrogenase